MTTVPFSDETLQLSVSKPMTTAGMFRRGIVRAMQLRQGQLAVDRPARITVTQQDVNLEADRIKAFRECCRFQGQAGGIPLSFPEIYFTPLMAEAMVSEAFPVSPLGIIHVRQTVQQHQPLQPNDRCSAVCELAAIRQSERGIEFDFLMQLVRDGQTLWSGLGTMLSRSKPAAAGRVRQPKDSSQQEPTPQETVTVHAAADTGRRYARISGDYNPHHLWKWTAMPVGFRRPIAHGMWTLSCALGIALADTSAECGVAAAVQFKRPLLMPGRAAFATDQLSAARDRVPLSAQCLATDTPLLRGEVWRPDDDRR